MKWVFLPLLVLCLWVACGCEQHQVVQFGDAIVSDTQPMVVTRPTAFRIRRGERVVSYAVEMIPLLGIIQATVALENSEPEVVVTAGAVSASGMRPVVKSTRIVAGATGTKFVFLAFPDGDIVYVQESSGDGPVAVTVTTTNKDQRVDLAVNEFGILQANGVLKRVKPEQLGDSTIEKAAQVLYRQFGPGSR